VGSPVGPLRDAGTAAPMSEDPVIGLPAEAPLPNRPPPKLAVITCGSYATPQDATQKLDTRGPMPPLLERHQPLPGLLSLITLWSHESRNGAAAIPAATCWPDHKSVREIS